MNYVSDNMRKRAAIGVFRLQPGNRLSDLVRDFPEETSI